MSLWDAFFALTKGVQASSARERIQRIYERLEPSFGYLRRKHLVQFLTYLIIDQNSGAWAGSIKVPGIGLSDEEREVLAAAHHEVRSFNSRCISEILIETPDLRRAVDPYSEQESISQPSRQLSLLPEELVSSVVSAFHNTEVVQELQARKDSHARAIPVAQQVTGAHALLEEITRVGVTTAPKRIKSMVLGTPPGSQHREVLHYLGAILGVRMSLALMNQLLLQAVVNDRLTVLDRSNVIRIKSNTWSLISHGLRCEYILNSKIPFRAIGAEPGEVILVKLPRRHADGLFYVERTSMRSDAKDGLSLRVSLREVNREFNPYPGFLEFRKV